MTTGRRDDAPLSGGPSMSTPLRLIAVAIMFVLTATWARAETQLAQVQAAFDALRKSDAALKQGDPQKAKVLLADIKSSAETLRGTAERFGKQAEEAEKRRQAEALEVTTLITQTKQAEDAADKEVGVLQAKIAGLQAHRANVVQNLEKLNQQAAPLRQEAEMRQRCDASVGSFFSNFGECMRLGFADLFWQQWQRTNNDIRDLNIQYQQAVNALQDPTKQLGPVEALLNQTRSRKTKLESDRKRLEQQAGVLKAAVVSLMDASLFWRDTVTLIGSSVTSIETLQQGVQLLIQRADKRSEAPVFDTYE